MLVGAYAPLRAAQAYHNGDAVSSIEVRLSAADDPPNRQGAADYRIGISSVFMDFDRAAEATGMPLLDPHLR
jgi:hypothetical protein